MCALVVNTKITWVKPAARIVVKGIFPDQIITRALNVLSVTIKTKQSNPAANTAKRAGTKTDPIQ